MNKVYVLAPREDWIIDRFVKEWNEDNADISVPLGGIVNSNTVVWLLADWCWQNPVIEFADGTRMSLPDFITNFRRKVITTIHHVVPKKFGPAQIQEFQARDQVTTCYHVPNCHTEAFIRPLTQKPIHVIPYWANQKIWRRTGTQDDLRKKHGLPTGCCLIGSFQRDTEGHDLISPKLEKGPDLLADAIIAYRDRCVPYLPVEVVLAGWRRQYLMRRLDAAGIKYHYFEKPPQETLNELYQTLSLYPVTARHEGGPQSLIECGLLGVPCVSRPVGIADLVLPPSAIADDVTQAAPAVPDIRSLTLPQGYEPYRKLIESL